MTRSLTVVSAGLAAGLAMLVTPALAAGPEPRPGTSRWVYSEFNPHYRDYLVDLSEARRELASDMRRAKTPRDRMEARREYRREVADARYDFTKEMGEKGYAVNPLRGTVTVEM